MTDIPLSQIRAGSNDRTHFKADELQALADNIAVNGLAQPITVRPIIQMKGHEPILPTTQEEWLLWKSIVNPPKALWLILLESLTEKVVLPSEKLIPTADQALPESPLSNPLKTRGKPSQTGFVTNGEWVKSTEEKQKDSITSDYPLIYGNGQSPHGETFCFSSNVLPLILSSNKIRRLQQLSVSASTLMKNNDGQPTPNLKTNLSNKTIRQCEIKILPVQSGEPLSVFEQGQKRLASPNIKAGKPTIIGQKKKIKFFRIGTVKPKQPILPQHLDVLSPPYTEGPEFSDLPENVAKDEIWAGYEIVMGERRFRAVRDILRYPTIEAMVKVMDDLTVSNVMLAENLQRKDLDVIEEAEAYQKRIAKYGWTQAECAAHCTVSVSRVGDRLKLLKLLPEVQLLVRHGHMPLGHALAMTPLSKNYQLIALRALEGKNLTKVQFDVICAELYMKQTQLTLFDDDQLFYATQELATDLLQPKTAVTAIEIPYKGATLYVVIEHPVGAHIACDKPLIEQAVKIT